MKLAIISDSHDNLPNIEKTLEWIKKEKISVLIHCGDVASRETLKKILDSFSGEIFLTLGNMDKGYLSRKDLSFLENITNLKIFDRKGELEIGNKKIGFTHFLGPAKTLARSQQYDLVFFGHTHKPWEEGVGDCRLVNPGNLAGLFYPATFAVYDPGTDQLKLKILDKLQ